MATGSATLITSIPTSESFAVFRPEGMPGYTPIASQSGLNQRVVVTPQPAPAGAAARSAEVAQKTLLKVAPAEVVKQKDSLTIAVVREPNCLESAVRAIFLFLTCGLLDIYNLIEFNTTKQLPASYAPHNINETFLNQLQVIAKTSNATPTEKKAAAQRCYDLYKQLQNATPEQAHTEHLGLIVELGLPRCWTADKATEGVSPQFLYDQFQLKLDEAVLNDAARSARTPREEAALAAIL